MNRPVWPVYRAVFFEPCEPVFPRFWELWIEVMEGFQCLVQSFPCNYLGLPLHFKQLRQVEVQPLIHKMSNRLPTWKGRFLNRASRLKSWTLSCPQCLPISSPFLLPKSERSIRWIGYFVIFLEGLWSSQWWTLLGSMGQGEKTKETRGFGCTWHGMLQQGITLTMVHGCGTNGWIRHARGWEQRCRHRAMRWINNSSGWALLLSWTMGNKPSFGNQLGYRAALLVMLRLTYTNWHGGKIQWRKILEIRIGLEVCGVCRSQSTLQSLWFCGECCKTCNWMINMTESLGVGLLQALDCMEH